MFQHWASWFISIILGIGVLFAPIPSTQVEPSERVIRIEARSFEYSPATFHVHPGDRVTIELVSMDVVHGLYIDGYDLNVIADPGETAVLEFTADKTGTFKIRCSVACGALHPFMLGKMTVGSNDLFLRGAVGLLFAAVGVIVLPILKKENKAQ